LAKGVQPPQTPQIQPCVFVFTEFVMRCSVVDYTLHGLFRGFESPEPLFHIAVNRSASAFSKLR